MGALLVGFDMYGAMNRHLPGFMPNSNAEHRFHGPPGRRGLRVGLLSFPLELRPGRRAGHRVGERHSRPSLKVFKPDDDRNEPVADEEVDRILTKIHREGEQSLTAKERRVMEKASREYRRRRGGD